MQNPKPTKPRPKPQATPLSSSSSSSSSSRTPLAPTPTGLRAQLNHLRPRHAFFRAEVFVHDIASVPYVSGEFGVKWRFRKVEMPRVGLLERVKRGRSSQGEGGNGEEGEGERRDSTSTGGSMEEMGTRPGYRSVSETTTSSTMTTTTQSSDGYLTVPTSKYTAPSIRSTNSSAPSIYLTPLASLSLVTLSSPSPSAFPSLPAGYVPTPAKGQSAFLPLKDHGVSWSLPLDTVLKMDVDRDTLQIAESPLKLVVLQKEEGARVQNPRLGAVYLNLAEYVDKGRVERRYLLRESKTNAVLKLSILLTPLSSPTHPLPNYIAPPLPKGEILTGIASFLDSDAYKRQRPRELELYGPYRDQEELEIDLMGVRRDSDSFSSSNSKDGVVREVERQLQREEDEDDGEESEEEVEKYTVPFDPARLPIAYGIKTTETLIDALFNPEVVYDKRDECPFTTYVDPVRIPKRGSRKKGSLYSSESASAEGAGGAEGREKGDGEGGKGEVKGVKAWFRRIGASRPGTPTSETFEEVKEGAKGHGHGRENSITQGLSFVLAPGVAHGGGAGASHPVPVMKRRPAREGVPALAVRVA